MRLLMMRRSWLLTGILSGLGLLAAGLLAFQPALPASIAHFVRSEFPQTFTELERDVRFGLAPGIPVENPGEAPSAPLPPIRGMIAGPLRVSSANPRYFEDGSGRIIYLTGSHTWANLVDSGGSNPPLAFNYSSYLDFLVANNHNFFRLWTWEQARWTVETSDNQYRFSPQPFQRTGPGSAVDGLPKFDLSKFNPDYFNRLRSRILQAGDRGIYVSIMLFDGWSIEKAKGPFWENSPWRGHPFNRSNNINSIDGDPNQNDSGEETHTLAVSSVTAVQEAYVRMVIDTVNDLDNVLYEISNESHSESGAWQAHMIAYIRQYEAAKPKQHPVGMTAMWPNGQNSDLFAGAADWISPNGNDADYAGSPPAASGSKVILADTDHICGVCGDRTWVWKSFTRGENVLYMDVYDGAAYGCGASGFNPSDPVFVSARKNMGYTLTYANRMNLAAALPLPNLCSTGFCLANPSASHAEYLLYNPWGGNITVNLSAAQGELQIEWLNPATGEVTAAGNTAGGGNRTFTPPFGGDAVLYLYQPIDRATVYLPLLLQ